MGRAALRAYTVVELLMALSVLAIGVTGVIAMQRVTVATSRHAKNLAIATRVAEAWADQLTADGALWFTDQAGANTRPTTQWLSLADPTQTVEWFIPAYSPQRAFGTAFSGLGNPVDASLNPGVPAFCAHLRFAFLHSETLPTAGNGVIRAQIRVFWLREDATAPLAVSNMKNLCTVDDATFATNVSAFHVVYLTTAIRQTPQGLL
jgi:type IV pilus assembly protein PilV